MTSSQDNLSSIDQQQGITSQQNSSDGVEGDPLASLINLLLDLNLSHESKSPPPPSRLPLYPEPFPTPLTVDSVASEPEFPNSNPSIHPVPFQPSTLEDDGILRLLPLLEKPPSTAMDVDYSVSKIEENFPSIPSSIPSQNLEVSVELKSTEETPEIVSSNREQIEEDDPSDLLDLKALEPLLKAFNLDQPSLQRNPQNTELKVSNPSPIKKASNPDDPLEQLQELMFGSNLTDDLEELKNQLLGSELPEVRELVDRITQQLNRIEIQIYEPQKLIELLLPSIGQLLNLKVNESKEELIQAFIPIIDEVIRGKGQTDRMAMSAAIADLIPEAIKKQIRDSPKEIAQAIGPEIGAAIREQIKIDRNEIAEALAPTIGRTIKEQVSLERDSMVDALYPVIGSTISRYLGEAIKDINDKVNSALSMQGIKRKIQSKVQGVSEAELILKEVSNFIVQAVFLIHKGSGLVIAQMQQPDQQLEAEMIGGMLTAIRSFVNDCIVQTGEVSELNEIEYGDSKIIIEVAGYCYLAIVVKGEPPKEFIKKIRQTMTTLIVKYSQPIEEFEGDPDSIPDGIPCQLEALMRFGTDIKVYQKPTTLLMGGAVVLSLILISFGIYQYRQMNLRQLEATLTKKLGSEPELAIYPLSVQVQGKTLELEGKVPTARLKDKAKAIAQQTAPNFQIENRIIAVKIPPDPVKIAREVKQMTTLLNQISGISISADYQRSQVTLKGKVIKAEDIQKITQAFEKIEGVDSVVANLVVQPLPIPTRIYFKVNSAELILKDLLGKLVPLAQYLKRYPDLKLRIIGYSHQQENAGKNNQLAVKRAQTVQNILEDLGIDRRRLEAVGKTEYPGGVDENQEPWLSQTVLFEIIPLEVQEHKPLKP